MYCLIQDSPLLCYLQALISVPQSQGSHRLDYLLRKHFEYLKKIGFKLDLLKIPIENIACIIKVLSSIRKAR